MKDVVQTCWSAVFWIIGASMLFCGLYWIMHGELPNLYQVMMDGSVVLFK